MRLKQLVINHFPIAFHPLLALSTQTVNMGVEQVTQTVVHRQPAMQPIQRQAHIHPVRHTPLGRLDLIQHKLRVTPRATQTLLVISLLFLEVRVPGQALLPIKAVLVLPELEQDLLTVKDRVIAMAVSKLIRFQRLHLGRVACTLLAQVMAMQLRMEIKMQLPMVQALSRPFRRELTVRVDLQQWRQLHLRPQTPQR